MDFEKEGRLFQSDGALYLKYLRHVSLWILGTKKWCCQMSKRICRCILDQELFFFFCRQFNFFFLNPVKVTLPKAVNSCIMKRHIKVPSFCLKVTATVDKGQWRIYHKTFATQTHRGQTAHSTMNRDLAVTVVQPWPDTDFTAPV